MVGWSIRAAIDSGCFDEVIVSTDCEEIARVSREWGASVPLMRPGHLASDTSTNVEVALDLADSLSWNDNAGLCLLQPTSPLRGKNHIREAYDLFKQSSSRCVVSVCECKLGREWLFPVDGEGDISVAFSGENSTRRQGRNLVVYPNGAIYFLELGALRKFGRLIFPTFTPYVMDSWQSLDIDTQIDFDVASGLLQKNES